MIAAEGLVNDAPGKSETDHMNRLFAILFALLLLPGTALAELTTLQAGRIGTWVGRILENAHFRGAKLDDKISGMFLTNYLNALDYNHMIFLQMDIDEFVSKYGTKLDNHLRDGDIQPAFRIFDRYLDRLEERTMLVEKLLEQEFDFTIDESFTPIRNDLPWPKDDAESAKLWRQRIKYELLQGRLSKEKPEETLGLIDRRYKRLAKTMREMGEERQEILQMYLTSLAHAYDPHSDYMSPQEATNFDIQHISLSLTGIGAQLIWEDGHTKIKDLIAGGPAALSKQLKPGDKIVAVAQGEETPVDVVEMRLNKVVEMIRGKKGTEVRLTILPSGSPDKKKIVSLIRDEIKFKDQLAKASVYEFSEEGRPQRIGVVTLPQFYEDCAEHVETLIQRLKKEQVQGIVLDLRRNGGGILDEAVQLTGLFIKNGPVVQVKEPSRKPHVLEDRDSDVAWDGPLVVAVGKLSASASEIVAAALQDYGRAVVVGDQSTHGKGTVQQVLRLESIVNDRGLGDPGNLKLTVSKFYRIAGGTTQKHGVLPDIVLPSLYDYLEIGEASLENCLPADSIEPTKYARQDLVKDYFTELKKRSADRVAASQDFAYMIEDINEIKERQENKSVSLNEADRLAEEEEKKQRIEARKKERAARVVSNDHIFELDLETAEGGGDLVPYAAKLAEETDLANAEAADPETAEDIEVEPPVDAQLEEIVEILRDYMELASVKSNSAVVLKAK